MRYGKDIFQKPYDAIIEDLRKNGIIPETIAWQLVSRNLRDFAIDLVQDGRKMEKNQVELNEVVRDIRKFLKKSSMITGYSVGYLLDKQFMVAAEKFQKEDTLVNTNIQVGWKDYAWYHLDEMLAEYSLQSTGLLGEGFFSRSDRNKPPYATHFDFKIANEPGVFRDDLVLAIADGVSARIVHRLICQHGDLEYLQYLFKDLDRDRIIEDAIKIQSRWQPVSKQEAERAYEYLRKTEYHLWDLEAYRGEISKRVKKDKNPFSVEFLVLVKLNLARASIGARGGFERGNALAHVMSLTLEQHADLNEVRHAIKAGIVAGKIAEKVFYEEKQQQG